jgi:hypothetical protein
MQIPNFHHYQQYKNKTLLWLETDSEESFNVHMKNSERRDQLKKYGWDRTGCITYSFNSHGYRCEEFDNSPGFIALGCSFTVGIGLPVDHTWPSIVGKELGLAAWNLGIGNGSMDTCFRFLYHYIEKLNVNYVLLLTPPVQRFELHTVDTLHCFNPQNIIHPMQRWWYECTSNGELNFYKNILSISQLCQQYNKKLIIKNYETDLFGLPARDRWPPARDMMHVGSAEHAVCAERFLTEIRIDQANL